MQNIVDAEPGPSIPRKRLAEDDIKGSVKRYMRGKKVDHKHLSNPSKKGQASSYVKAYLTYLRNHEKMPHDIHVDSGKEFVSTRQQRPAIVQMTHTSM